MRHAKIQLSPAEENLLSNADVILTKNRVLAKIKTLMERVQEAQLEHAATFSNVHVFDTTPKISRGENYLGLPYLILDYPRVFKPGGIFAIRSFFWWGRFFSSTLHLSGNYKALYAAQLADAFPTFSKHHISINADPWQHHFEPDNYIPVSALVHEDFKKLVQAHDHLKLAIKMPVANWVDADAFLFENWKLFLQVLF
ncbi:MAG TPA: hypothetical protein VM010_01295 [Chitinophagaceae bacterium]|nr:hypothetical protein [Chitinophagaceae bacterium]